MGAKRESLIDQVRRAARECGLSQNGLARATGLDVAAVNRFVLGKRGLSMEALDTLAAALDLHIVVGKPKATPTGKGRPGRLPKCGKRKEG